MAAITATNSATPSIQASLSRVRLTQAQREADQAEANARDLRAQADDAEQQAAQSQNNVRKISAIAQRDEATYASPRGNKDSDVPVKVQNLVESMYSATSEKRTLSGNSLKTDASAPTVVNIQGQRTGRIVNITA